MLQREVILVIGQTGSGKTTWTRAYVRRLARVLVADAGFREYDVTPYDDADALVDKLAKDGGGAFRVSYTPLTDEFPPLCDLARELGDVHFVLEEADRFPLPRDCQEYDELISRGRHYGVSLIGVSLHPFKLPPDLRRQATRIICFKQVEPGDLRWLQEVLGDHAQILPDLQRFEYLDWTPDGVEKKVLDKPAPVVLG